MTNISFDQSYTVSNFSLFILYWIIKSSEVYTTLYSTVHGLGIGHTFYFILYMNRVR